MNKKSKAEETAANWKITSKDVIRKGTLGRMVKDGFVANPSSIVANDEFRRMMRVEDYPKWTKPPDERMFEFAGNLYWHGVERDHITVIDVRPQKDARPVILDDKIYRKCNVLVQPYNEIKHTYAHKAYIQGKGITRSDLVCILARRYYSPLENSIKIVRGISYKLGDIPYKVETVYGTQTFNIWQVLNQTSVTFSSLRFFRPEDINLVGVRNRDGHYISLSNRQCSQLLREMYSNFMDTAATQAIHESKLLFNAERKLAPENGAEWEISAKQHDITVGWPDIPEVQKEVARVRKLLKQPPQIY